jgi:2'-5' RNA ligase
VNERVRAFFAVWPDDVARRSLARLAAAVAQRTGGRATRESNLHVTLAFIGEVAEARLQALADCGAAAACAVDPFVLTLARLGGAGRSLAWIEPVEIDPSMRALHAALARALAHAGFTVESRPFAPHVTLSRRGTTSARASPPDPIGWRVEHLSLVGSVTGGQASTYREIVRWPLGTGARGSSSGRVDGAS